MPPPELTTKTRCKRGYMHKRGDWSKKWQCRWFTLDESNKLHYYEPNPDDRAEPKGCIDMADATTVMCDAESPGEDSCEIEVVTEPLKGYKHELWDPRRKEWAPLDLAVQAAAERAGTTLDAAWKA